MYWSDEVFRMLGISDPSAATLRMVPVSRSWIARIPRVGKNTWLKR